MFSLDLVVERLESANESRVAPIVDAENYLICSYLKISVKIILNVRPIIFSRGYNETKLCQRSRPPLAFESLSGP